MHRVVEPEAPDFGGHYSKTRREIDDGRNSIAMPVRAGGRVLACVNLTWRRKALTLTEVVQRYAGDLRAAVTTIENRLADAGVPITSTPAPRPQASRNPLGDSLRWPGGRGAATGCRSAQEAFQHDAS